MDYQGSPGARQFLQIAKDSAGSTLLKYKWTNPEPHLLCLAWTPSGRYYFALSALGTPQIGPPLEPAADIELASCRLWTLPRLAFPAKIEGRPGSPLTPAPSASWPALVLPHMALHGVAMPPVSRTCGYIKLVFTSLSLFLSSLEATIDCSSPEKAQNTGKITNSVTKRSFPQPQTVLLPLRGEMEEYGYLIANPSLLLEDSSGQR